MVSKKVYYLNLYFAYIKMILFFFSLVFKICYKNPIIYYENYKIMMQLILMVMHYL